MTTDGPRLRPASDGYRLVDAGDGRRLEAFGKRLVDRPAPTASAAKLDPPSWTGADLRFQRESGWEGRPAALEPWTVRLEVGVARARANRLRLELRPTASGQVGLFPEHLANASWLEEQVRLADRPSPTVLNLFAYTGLATLALAAAGATVVHVDAARTAIGWARRNARHSGLGDRPIRWIVDEAAAFVAREGRRGRRYDGFVLDPPSWGHAPDGGAWRFDDRLAALLDGCAAIAEPGGAFCLLSAHTAGVEPGALGVALGAAFGGARSRVEVGPLAMLAESGARLVLGGYARLTR
jgi:23S rRNA (cytosine1962-C5)-methyltransferase